MSLISRRMTWLLGGGIGLAVTGMLFGWSSGSTTSEALLPVVGFALVYGAAVSVALRDGRRPLQRLMFALALVYLLQTLTQSTNPYLYTLGRAVRPIIEAMLIWVMLAFPTGHLRDFRARAVVFITLFILPLIWLLGLITSADIPMGGRFVTCSINCPRNVLFLVSAPEVSHNAYLVFRLLGVASTVAAALLLLQRLLAATPLMRQTLAPVLFASICRTLSIAVFLWTGYGSIALTVTLWLVPTAIVLGLLRGRLYMASALQKLVTGLSARPNAAQLHQLMVKALGDPTLGNAYRSHAHWVDDSGAAIALPAPGDSRQLTLVNDAKHQPVAALSHDIGIDDEPLLVEAVASAMHVALESQRAEIELASSRSEAAAEERRRIERDLHDGAQQRLIALRIKLSVTQRIMEKDHRRAGALMRELDGDVEAALREVRALAHGQAPSLLASSDISAALRQLAAQSGATVNVLIDEVGKLAPATEQALYFCASEALQNASKHAPPQTPVQLQLSRRANGVHLRIENACAAGPAQSDGHGLRNMQERIRSVGGRCDCGVQSGGLFVVDIQVPA